MSQIKSVNQAASFMRKIEGQPTSKQLDIIKEWVFSLEKAQTIPKERGSFRQLVKQDFENHLIEYGIAGSNKVCEIGGPYNSFADLMPDYEFEFLSLFPAKGYDNVTVADATQCDHVPSETYDAIFSISVFEHISKPWEAAKHLTRLLKPGGIVYHVAPFSYFYHGAPADYWRFTPDAFKVLFNELKPIKAEFFGGNRRRDNRGSPANPVDKDGGEQFSLDPFGGWRENWHSIYVGKKELGHAGEKLELAKRQVIINLVKVQMDRCKVRAIAIDRVYEKLMSLQVSIDQELSLVSKDKSNFKFSRKEIVELWKKRQYMGADLTPSYNRFVMAAKIGW